MILTLHVADCGSNTDLSLPSFNHPYRSLTNMTTNLGCFLSFMERSMYKGQPLFSTIQKLKSLVSVKCITCLVVMHPVQHDLRSPVPSSSHVPGHLIVCVSGQAKIQDLQNRKDTHQILQWNNVN